MAVNLEDAPVTPFLKKVVAFSSGGPFLEGYVLSIVGVAFIQMSPELNIDGTWAGIIGVAALVGLTLGALIGGWATDLLGRKKMFVADLIAIIILSLCFLFVTDALQVAILRFLIGIAIGADYPIATAIIAEFAPRKYRAICLGFIAGVWYLGANVALLVGYFSLASANSWRWVLASSVCPCVIILLGRWYIPESPRWLYRKGRVSEANAIIHSIYGTSVMLEDEKVEKTSYRKLFEGAYFQRIIFISIIWLCQVVPMFAIYTYGPMLMSEMGLGAGHDTLIGEVIIGMFFLVGTIPAMILTEKWGRRPVLIWSYLGMTISLAVLGFIPGASALTVTALFGIYALCSGGPGNLQWLYPNELFPTDIRASAMGLATAFSRIGTVLSTYVFPSALAYWGEVPILFAGAVISAVGLLTSCLLAPETKQVPLAITTSPDFKGRHGN